MNIGTKSAVGSFHCSIQMDLPSESNLLLNDCSPSSNLTLIRTVIMSPDVYWAIHSVQFTLTSRSPSTRPNYVLLKKKVKSSFVPCPPFLCPVTFILPATLVWTVNQVHCSFCSISSKPTPSTPTPPL